MEKERINIEPQIYAGNLLFERNFDLATLKKAKQDLIDAIEEAFERKYGSNPKKIKKENTIKELFLRLILSLITFYPLYKFINMQFTASFLDISHEVIAALLALGNFIPLFWLKKFNANAVKKARKESEKKNMEINKIKTELKF